VHGKGIRALQEPVRCRQKNDHYPFVQFASSPRVVHDCRRQLRSEINGASRSTVRLFRAVRLCRHRELEYEAVQQVAVNLKAGNHQTIGSEGSVSDRRTESVRWAPAQGEVSPFGVREGQGGLSPGGRFCALSSRGLSTCGLSEIRGLNGPVGSEHGKK